jgi:hypothetical protein
MGLESGGLLHRHEPFEILEPVLYEDHFGHFDRRTVLVDDEEVPVSAHTRDGIMRANWDALFLPRSGVGLPAFSPEQARLLRLRAAGRLLLPR